MWRKGKKGENVRVDIFDKVQLGVVLGIMTTLQFYWVYIRTIAFWFSLFLTKVDQIRRPYSKRSLLERRIFEEIEQREMKLWQHGVQHGLGFLLTWTLFLLSVYKSKRITSWIQWRILHVWRCYSTLYKGQNIDIEETWILRSTLEV